MPPVIVPVISDGNATSYTPTEVAILFGAAVLLVIILMFLMPLFIKILEKVMDISDEFWDKVFKKKWR